MVSSTTILVSVLGFAEIALIALTGYFFSQLVGNKDTANELSKTTTVVTSLMGGIVLLHTALWYMYFIYNPLSMNLYFLLTTSLTLVFSLTALGLSIVNRS